MLKIIEFDKTSFVLGLNWFSFTDKKYIPKKSQEEFDIYCISKNKKQMGLGKASRNDEYLTNSLAASLKIETTFIGVFKLTDIDGVEFNYLLAVDNGIILADNCYSSEETEQLQNVLQSIRELGTISDEAIFFKTYEESLTFFRQHLLRSRKYFNINQIRPLYVSKKVSNKNLKLAATALLVIGVIYGIFYYLDMKNLAALRADLLFSKQSMEAKINDIYANTHKYFKMAWQDKNFPIDTYNKCKTPMLALPIVVNGWSLDKAICSNELSSYWKHNPQANYIDLPYDGTLQQNPKEVLAKHPIDDVMLVQKDVDYTKLLTKDDSSKIMYQLTQNMAANLTLSFEKQEVREFKDLKISILAPWTKAKFEWKSIPSSLILNNSLFASLNTIPSLSITRIEYSNEQWSIIGEFYVKI